MACYCPSCHLPRFSTTSWGGSSCISLVVCYCPSRHLPQIIHNWLRETILYKSCGLLLSLSSVTWILHHQLRRIISYSVNAGFKRFYRVLRGVKKNFVFWSVYKSSTIFGSKFLVLKSQLIHRKIRYPKRRPWANLSSLSYYNYWWVSIDKSVTWTWMCWQKWAERIDLWRSFFL